jgi:hypothetical protein
VLCKGGERGGGGDGSSLQQLWWWLNKRERDDNVLVLSVPLMFRKDQPDSFSTSMVVIPSLSSKTLL